jgi:hypothetical protein
MRETSDFVEGIGLERILNINPPYDETNRIDICDDLLDLVRQLRLRERLEIVRRQDHTKIVHILR